jgi:putative two-component system response regulator
LVGDHRVVQSFDHPPSILVVEDDPSVRSLLVTILRREGYRTAEAASGPEALERARARDIDAVLLDVGLPGQDGLSVCQALRADAATLLLPIILLTGSNSTDDLVRGLDAGADDFLGKPFRTPELLARIRSMLRLRSAMAEMEAAHGVVAALASAVEAKDVTTENHCKRLAGFAHRLASSLDLDAVALRGVVYGALLHDVGKIGVPEAILSKPGPLTDEEWTVMRRHPVIGEEICRPLVSSRLFTPIVRHHHERWDGLGYPDKLVGERIPLGARIVAIVDAFDAMVHDRPYRPAMPLERALQELRTGAGRQFDPGLVPLFVSAVVAGPEGFAVTGRAPHAHLGAA